MKTTKTHTMKFKRIAQGLYRATKGNITFEIAKQYISNEWNLSAYNELTQEYVIDTNCKKKSHCIEYASNVIH